MSGAIEGADEAAPRPKGVALRSAVVAFTMAGLLAWPATASADQDRQVRVVNDTGHVISEFHASNVSQNEWGDDILGVDELEDGKSVVIDFDDGTGHCKFDFKVVFDDGSVLERNGINVCAIDSYNYE